MAKRYVTRSFDDCREALDQALSEGGISIACDSYETAIVFRHRCNNFRVYDRQYNTQVYTPDNPNWGKSVYDHLILSIPNRGEKNCHVVNIYVRPPPKFTIHPLAKPGDPELPKHVDSKETPVPPVLPLYEYKKIEPEPRPDPHSNKAFSAEDLDLGPELPEDPSKPPDV
jgi:hypothetical protein